MFVARKGELMLLGISKARLRRHIAQLKMDMKEFEFVEVRVEAKGERNEGDSVSEEGHSERKPETV